MREPLMIMCPGRSFSSVVCSVVGQHPDAVGLPEVNLFTHDTVGQLLDSDVPFVGIPGVSTGLRRAVSELKFGEQTDESIIEVDKWLRTKRDWTGGRMFKELIKMADGRMLVEKSPTNTRGSSAKRILDTFPNAFYFHIARHPRATCRSQIKAHTSRKESKMMKEYDNQNYWRERHELAVTVSRHVEPWQYMYLHGEWFFEEPELWLKQICEWVGLSTDADAIDQMMKPELSPFAVEGPSSARYGNNRGFIENPHLRVGKIKEENLDDPLEWVTQREEHFEQNVRSMAHYLGYAK